MPPSMARTAARRAGAGSREVRPRHRKDLGPMRKENALPADLSVAGEVWDVKQDLVDVGQVERTRDTEQAPHPIEPHAGLEPPAERVDDVRQVSGVERARLSFDRQQHLLLTGGPPEVTIDVVVSGPDILQRAGAVEVLGARQPGHALVAVQIAPTDIVRVEIVEHRIGHEEIDPAELVDQLDQTRKPNPRVLVDVNVEVALDRGNRGGRPAVGVGGVDLRAPAGRERYPEVAGYGEHGDVFAGRLDPHQDHRLRQWGFVLAIVVGTEQQDGEWRPG